jgi:hypothetical protein
MRPIGDVPPQSDIVRAGRSRATPHQKSLAAQAIEIERFEPSNARGKHLVEPNAGGNATPSSISIAAINASSPERGASSP